MKIIDLSITIENSIPSDPPFQIPKIKYVNHTDAVESMLAFFEGATVNDLPDGKAWAVEHLELTTHSGTHVDAPYHYHPKMNNGEIAWTIDEIPLDWFIGNGVVVDFTNRKNGELILAQDFIDYFNKIGYQLQPNDIVLVYTGASKKWGTSEYLISGCGMGREATLWLIEQGVNVMGTDAWSWDRPLSIISQEYNKTKDNSIIWEGHFAGIEKAYCHMEKLTNLDKLPLHGFKINCLPIKIKNASAGWTRAIAIIEED